MTNETRQSRIESEFIAVQLEQAIETFRTQYSWLTQVTTALVLANATVVGFAITTQTSGILLIGPLFPTMILYVGYRTFRLMLPTVYTAIGLERKYGGPNADWLISTFLSTVISPEYVAELRNISSIENSVERNRQLRQVSPPVIWRKPLAIALVLVAFGQVVMAIALSISFNWRLFYHQTCTAL